MKKKKAMPIPCGFTSEDIKTETSICTGEKRVGFYSKKDKKLHFDELVKNEKDITAFYEKYGIKP